MSSAPSNSVFASRRGLWFSVSLCVVFAGGFRLSEIGCDDCCASDGSTAEYVSKDGVSSEFPIIGVESRRLETKKRGVVASSAWVDMKKKRLHDFGSPLSHKTYDEEIQKLASRCFALETQVRDHAKEIPAFYNFFLSLLEHLNLNDQAQVLSKHMEAAKANLGGTHGWTFGQLEQAGYNADLLESAGYTSEQLHSAGINTPEKLNEFGYTEAHLRTAGITTAEKLAEFGYTTEAQLRTAGINTAEKLAEFGYREAQLRTAGINTAKKLVDLGYTEEQLLHAGFKQGRLNQMKVIRDVDTITQLVCTGGVHSVMLKVKFGLLEDMEVELLAHKKVPVVVVDNGKLSINGVAYTKQDGVFLKHQFATLCDWQEHTYTLLVPDKEEALQHALGELPDCYLWSSKYSVSKENVLTLHPLGFSGGSDDDDDDDAPQSGDGSGAGAAGSDYHSFGPSESDD